MKSLDISLNLKTNYSTNQNKIAAFKVFLENITKKNKALKILTFL
mgnify:CR=1 FL=1